MRTEERNFFGDKLLLRRRRRRLPRRRPIQTFPCTNASCPSTVGARCSSVQQAEKRNELKKKFVKGRKRTTRVLQMSLSCICLSLAATYARETSQREQRAGRGGGSRTFPKSIPQPQNVCSGLFLDARPRSSSLASSSMFWESSARRNREIKKHSAHEIIPGLLLLRARAGESVGRSATRSPLVRFRSLSFSSHRR